MLFMHTALNWQQRIRLWRQCTSLSQLFACKSICFILLSLFIHILYQNEYSRMSVQQISAFQTLCSDDSQCTALQSLTNMFCFIIPTKIQQLNYYKK